MQNKMKKSELLNIIREEIARTLLKEKTNLPRTSKLSPKQLKVIAKYLKKGYVFPNDKPENIKNSSVIMKKHKETIIINIDGEESKQ